MLQCQRSKCGENPIYQLFPYFLYGIGMSEIKSRPYISFLSPGRTALDGLITVKKRQKVVSRETADVVRVEDELQPRCRRGRTCGKIGTASDAE